MLTPGIEYFGAPSDGDAIAYSQGRVTWRLPVIRADFLAPEGLFAILGGVIGGRSISALMSPESLRRLDLEHRDGARIQLLGLPPEIGDALRDAAPDDLEQLGERASVYFPGIPVALVTALLGQLASTVRTGRGGLYARRITSDVEARPRWLDRFTRALRAAAPSVGLAMSALVLLFGSYLLASSPVPWVPVVVAGALALWSFLTIVRRHGDDDGFARRIGEERPGSYLLVSPVDRDFWSRLDALGSAVGRSPERPSGTEEWAYLAVEPSGIDLYVDRRFVAHLPVDAILGVTVAEITPDFGPTAEDPRAYGLVVVVHTGDGEAEPWRVPIVRRDEFGVGRRRAAAAARDLGRILGVPVEVPGA